MWIYWHSLNISLSNKLRYHTQHSNETAITHTWKHSKTSVSRFSRYIWGNVTPTSQEDFLTRDMAPSGFCYIPRPTFEELWHRQVKRTFSQGLWHHQVSAISPALHLRNCDTDKSRGLSHKHYGTIRFLLYPPPVDCISKPAVCLRCSKH